MGAIADFEIYVRYCETDAGGHVNNTSYFIYLEEARTKFFATIGLSPQEREDLNFIVAHAECNFIAQAYAGQTLKLTTTISKIGTKSFTMAHDIIEVASGTLIAQGSAVVVCFNYKEQKSIDIPGKLRSILESNVAIV